MNVRPLLIDGHPTTIRATVHCAGHSHECELDPHSGLGWLLDGGLPDTTDEAGLTWECTGVLGDGSRDPEPCDSTVSLPYAPTNLD